MWFGLIDVIFFLLSVLLLYEALGVLPWASWFAQEEAQKAAQKDKPNMLHILLSWAGGLFFFKHVMMPTVTMVLGPLGEIIRSLAGS